MDLCNQQVGGSSPSTSSTTSQDARCVPFPAGAENCTPLPPFSFSLRDRFAGSPREYGGFVGGSNGRHPKIEYGGIPEWPKGADCKSVVSDFGGSNPPSPTKNSEHPSGWSEFFDFRRRWIRKAALGDSPVDCRNRRGFFRRKSESTFLLQVSCGLPGRIPTEQKSACPPLSDIDANPDANGDGTKRAWLDKMR